MRVTGLTPEHVVSSRAQYGANVLTPREPLRKEFHSKFEDPVIRILIIAALISFSVGALERKFFYESLGIVAILVATVLAFWTVGSRE